MVWLVSILFFFLSMYCVVSAFLSQLPMLKWGSKRARRRVPMSSEGRIALGITIALFACAPLVGRYKPHLWSPLILIYVLSLIAIVIIALRDGRRHDKKPKG
jgi:hypothetical protein